MCTQAWPHPQEHNLCQWPSCSFKQQVGSPAWHLALDLGFNTFSWLLTGLLCLVLSILAVPQPLDAPSLPSAGSGFLSQPCLNSLLPLPDRSTAVILPRQGLALPKLPCACEGQHGLFPVPSWSTWLFLRVNANRAHELHVKPLDS